ncbi:MAG: universal stress protein [Ktedonobacteraceae bacterium]
MKNYILVPLDGSALSEVILPHAVAVAQATKSALLLLQVLEPVFEPIFGAIGLPDYVEEEQLLQMRDEQFAAINHYLEKIASQLRANGLEVITKVIDGNHPATQILWETEHDPQILTIAMMTHGRRGILHWLFGSVAAEIVQVTPRPLLLLRPQESDRSFSMLNFKAAHYQNIVVPLDASPFAEQALDQASELALTMNANIHLISIVPFPHVLPVHIHKEEKESQLVMRAVLHDTEVKRREQYLRQKAEQFKERGIRVHTDVASGHPAEGILGFCSQNEQTLLVMTTHGRSGLRHIVLGSVAMKVVQEAHVPVLLVRGKHS